jgi:hypothetical protein
LAGPSPDGGVVFRKPILRQKVTKITASHSATPDSIRTLRIAFASRFSVRLNSPATPASDLVIRLERAADVAWGSHYEPELWRNTGAWGTIVSEAWLMKKKP